MISALLYPFRRAIALAVGALGLLGLGWITGWANARQAAGLRDLRGYRDTRKAIDDADDDTVDDDGVLREFLHNRGQQ